MAEANEENDLPDAQTCDKLCREFATITQTDTACGHFYLQDCNWNLEFQIAVDRWLYQNRPETSSSTNSTAENSGVTANTFSSQNLLRLISWNIDGLDDKNRISRTQAVCTVIKRENPTVLFLQEVIAETYKVLENELNDSYMIIASSERLREYFTAVLLHRNSVKLRSFEVIPFPTTRMYRRLLYVEADVFGKPFVFMTSHLESTKQEAVERIKQFKQCLEVIGNVKSDKTVFFGGDLNLQDSEIDSLGKEFPRNVLDTWKLCGSKKDTKFTWDCTKNDNLNISGKFKPRCRFDRMFIRHSDTPTVKNVDSFRLIGQERIRSCLCFPSDHWGISCDMTV